MKFQKILIAVAIVFTCSSARAQQFARVGTAGAQFLEIGIDARAVAMGEACIAVSNLGAGSLFRNPACSVTLQNKSLMLSHSSWIADVGLNAAALTMTFGDYGTFGFSVISLTSGDIEVTTVEHQDGTGETFSTSNTMIGLTYAKKVTDRFSMGGTAKYIGERLEERQARTFCFDVGMLYDTGYRSLQFAAVIQNFGPPLTLDGTYRNYDNGELLSDERKFNPYHLPMTFKVGMSYNIELPQGQHIVTTLDATHPRDNVERLDFGAEYRFWEGLAVRGGYSSGHDSRGISFGAGFLLSAGSLGDFELNYAYSDFGVLDGVQRFSMNLNF